jgi:hypothetical protein
MALIEDISRLDQLTAQYREAIAELRGVLEAVEPPVTFPPRETQPEGGYTHG